MAVARFVQIALVLLLSIIVCSLAGGYGDSGGEGGGSGEGSKHVIEAPIKIKFIHHHKTIKYPVLLRNHIHHHKHYSHENVYVPLKHKPKVIFAKVVGGASGGGGDDDGDDDEGYGHGFGGSGGGGGSGGKLVVVKSHAIAHGSYGGDEDGSYQVHHFGSDESGGGGGYGH